MPANGGEPPVTADWKTGWPPPELMQDDCRALSVWLANPLAARLRKGGVTINHQTAARLRKEKAMTAL